MQNLSQASNTHERQCMCVCVWQYIDSGVSSAGEDTHITECAERTAKRATHRRFCTCECVCVYGCLRACRVAVRRRVCVRGMSCKCSSYTGSFQLFISTTLVGTKSCIRFTAILSADIYVADLTISMTPQRVTVIL